MLEVQSRIGLQEARSTVHPGSCSLGARRAVCVQG